MNTDRPLMKLSQALDPESGGKDCYTLDEIDGLVGEMRAFSESRGPSDKTGREIGGAAELIAGFVECARVSLTDIEGQIERARRALEDECALLEMTPGGSA